MMRSLLKKQYLEILYLLFGRGRQGKSRSQGMVVAMAVIMVIAILILAANLVIVEAVLCGVLVANDQTDMYFGFISLGGLLFGIIGSVFMAYSAIFKAKDNEILLALPIPIGRIILSRLLGCYLVAAVSQALILLPGYIIYYYISGLVNGSRNAIILLGDVVLLVTAPLLTLAVSCFLAWVIALITRRIKHKSIVGVIVSVAAFLAYYYFILNMGSYVDTVDMEQGKALYGGIQKYVLPVYELGMAGAGHFVHYIIFTVLSVGSFAMVYGLLAGSFLALSASKTPASKKEYTGSGWRQRSPQRALLNREFRHMLSSTTIMLNGALGSVLAVVLGIVLCWRKDALAEFLGLFEITQSQLFQLASVAVVFIVSMNLLAGVSVSLEGKTLWRVKSLPLDATTILQAKERHHLLMTVIPSLLAMGLIAWAYRPSPLDGAATVFLVVVLLCLQARVDLIIGLLKPKLDWKDEAMAMKMSVAVLMCMFGNWLILIAASLIFGLAMVLAMPVFAGMTLVAGLGLMLYGVAGYWLVNRGPEVFLAL